MSNRERGSWFDVQNAAVGEAKTTEKTRTGEKEDPAGSFHNEGHPLVCVCVCASVLITSV